MLGLGLEVDGGAVVRVVDGVVVGVRGGMTREVLRRSRHRGGGDGLVGALYAGWPA